MSERKTMTWGEDLVGYFQTYAATEGLDRFPEEKRFFLWLRLHKKLKTDDPDYRAACRRFVAKIIGVTLLFSLILMLPAPFFLGDTISVGAEVALTFGSLVLYIPWGLVVSFRHQKWMNARVAEEIRREARDGAEP